MTGSVRGPRLVLLGKQGAGKGTQADRIAQRFGVEHLSTGKIFRDSADAGVEAGVNAKAFMDRGELVPDDLVVEVVAERFQNPREVQSGFVLDGFPRTLSQAYSLEEILDGFPLDVVIDLDVPTPIVVERMRARQREDDTEEAIQRRLELYEQETRPLIDFYTDRALLVRVDGVGTEDEVFTRLLDAIDAAWDPTVSASAR